MISNSNKKKTTSNYLQSLQQVLLLLVVLLLLSLERIDGWVIPRPIIITTKSRGNSITTKGGEDTTIKLKSEI